MPGAGELLSEQRRSKAGYLSWCVPATTGDRVLHLVNGVSGPVGVGTANASPNSWVLRR